MASDKQAPAKRGGERRAGDRRTGATGFAGEDRRSGRDRRTPKR